MPLEQEQSTYMRELPKLLGSMGKFALVHGDQIEGTYDTYADAIKVGYGKFGLKPFMVKQIAATEPIHSFTRDIIPCHI